MKKDPFNGKPTGKHLAFIFLIALFTFFIVFISLLAANAQDNWEQRYTELLHIINEHYDEPPAETDDLGTFLYWIGTKGNELARAKQLLDEANRMYIAHPDNQTYNNWVSEFFELVKHAEDSGNLTVWLASVKLLHIHENDIWITPLWAVNQFGRKIYLKAKESGFSTIDPEQRSICMLNYSLGMLESDQANEEPYEFSGSGFSLYRGRLLLDGIPVNGGEAMTIPDFLDTYCDGRKMFYRWMEGEPQKPILYAFMNVDKIREECKWWGFGEIWQDATDLMNEYYEDALCKIPPHESKLGHKYFLQLAEEKNLEKSIKYNKGFYGTLYGKVEILIDGSKEPAPGAKVTVDDYDETWTTTADENGRYKIEHVILHKDCSPFDISARYKGYQVDDTYDGPMTKPDTTNSTRHRKDLLIKPGINYQWYGNLTALLTKKSQCLKNETDFRLQQANIKIKARHIDVSQPIIAIDLGERSVTGSVSGKYEFHSEEELKNDRHYKHEIRNIQGMKVFPVTTDNLSIMVVSEKIMDQGAMQQMAAMAKKVATGNYSQEEIEKIAGEMEKQMDNNRETFPVKVIVQLFGSWSGNASFYEYIYEVDNGNIIENKEEHLNKEIDIMGPIALELKGTCTKKKNGEVTIQASVHETKKDPDCVQLSTNATFTMKRIVSKSF